MARCIFAVFLCFAVSLSARAQSNVSGSYLLEPFVGHFFSSPIKDVAVVGGRATWRRSYSRTFYASFLYGGDSSRDEWGGPGSDTRQFEEWSHALGVIGVGSTLVDRDATGSGGFHVLLGVGYVKSSTFEEWETRQTDGSVHRSEFERIRSGPVVDFALAGEIELFSPRILLRGHASAYVGLGVGRDDYDGALWLPGVSLAAGIAAAL